MQKAFETIKQLVADFKAKESAFLSTGYQERQVQQDFIDKFFSALGWDVAHNIQKDPYQQEAHIENKVHMAGSPRRADYAFCLAPNFRDPKFFVEAKKPSRDLANPDDYYQTIRYGWNANTPIAILTDFEEFHILDCRFKPNIKDVMIHKIEVFHYSDYANEEKFSRIYWLFSREAVANGSLEKRAAELPKLKGKAVKGGYQPVDEAFLEELDKYREILAKAFKKSNPDLQSEELTEAVQRIIDRLVFIRFLEDKQIEEPFIVTLSGAAGGTKSLSSMQKEDSSLDRPAPLAGGRAGSSRQRASGIRMTTNEGIAWKKFTAHCRSLEPKYNGLVFKPHKVLDGKEFIPPDDEEFGTICRELSDPHSPYNFDQIPISILGSIYERFLGKVVHATDKRVKVEEKPEVRKAGGVYYTPEYIVRYIVSETVGKLLYGETVAATDGRGDGKNPTSTTSATKTPEEVSQMSFADIACGSGSFLIEVYAQLLDYHIRYFNANPDKQKETDVFEREGKLHLTLKKKKEILINNVYGVDIDFQATEVTQLSLYLKLLEDVTMHDAHQFGIFKETILPDLRKNIINGNSLIGTDIYDGDLFAPQAQIRTPHIPPSYEGGSKGGLNTGTDKLKPMNFEDAFPAVMKRGGFDAVVGNPPYGAEFDEGQKFYIKQKYRSYKYRFDSYIYFFERAITNIKANGYISYITPELWLTLDNCDALRSFIQTNASIEIIRILGEGVFQQAVVNTIVAVIRKQKNARMIHIVNQNAEEWNIDLKEIELSKGVSINYRLRPSESGLIRKIKEIAPVELSKYGDSIQGITPYDRYQGQSADIIKNRAYHHNKQKNKNCGKWLEGKDVSRYELGWSGEWLEYGDWLAAPRDPKYFSDPRLLFREVPGPEKRIQATLAVDKLYHGHSITPFKLNADSLYDLLFLLAIANSRLISWYGGLMLPNFGKNIFPKLNPQDIKQLPIRTINFDDPQDKSRHDHIVKLVEQMLEAKEKLSNAKTEAETNRLEMQCQTLDRQIDEVVYELYGLTEEEIKIVEGKD